MYKSCKKSVLGLPFPKEKLLLSMLDRHKKWISKYYFIFSYPVNKTYE